MSLVRRFLPLLLLLLVSPSARAEEAALSIPFEEYQLDNGMKVVLHRDDSLPIVAVNIWYDVGSKDERGGRSGFAHLFEHLMFMGTERAPDFDVIMESGGGWNNASTSEDRTNYYSVGPANLLDTLLWLEADRLGSLDDAMTQEKLDLQRDVVLNERRQGYENQPYGQSWLIIPEELYPVGHPYHDPVIGSAEDIEAAQLQDVLDFFHQYYVPSNATLVVAGDFDSEAVKLSIERYFGRLPAGETLVRQQPPRVEAMAAKRQEITDKVQLPRLYMVWHSPSFYEPGDAEMDVAAWILAQGKNSRLYKSLVYEQQIADSVSAFQSSGLSSLFMIVATAQPGHELQELEKAIMTELDKLRASVPEKRELERALNNLETDYVRSLESIAARADMLNRYAFYAGTPGYLADDLGRYQDILPEDVQRVLVERLTADERFVLYIVPEPAKAELPGAGSKGEVKK